MEIDEDHHQQGRTEDEIYTEKYREGKTVEKGARDDRHCQFDQRVLPGDLHFAASALCPKDNEADDRDVVVPVDGGAASRAV